MAIASHSRGLRYATIAVCIVLFSLSGEVRPAQSAATASLRLEPAISLVNSGDRLKLTLFVAAENLNRAELRLGYAWPTLEIQDADPGRAEVQIEPGPIFRDCCVMRNKAAEGTIEFTAQRSPDKDPFSGSGELAYITLEVQEPQPGIYTIFFDRNESRLLDGEGHSIPIGEFTDAVIIVPSRTIAGQVTREGWSNHARSRVNVVLFPAVPPHDPLAWGHACTDTAGDFQVETWNDLPTTGDILPPDDPPTSPTCTSLWAYVRLNFTNYLSECYWQCADGEVVHLGRRNLEGGDVIADGCINILDITKIIDEFGHRVDPPCYVPFSECPLDPPLPNEAPSSDINGDCAVNILDLSMAAENFGLCSSCR